MKVVFFKTALSTGWDCPRAEVMMSFRKAKDATFIAQLVGRMVRTPLARRIESDETLNDVSLFLPYYDAKSLDGVIARLSDPDHDHVPPVEVAKGEDAVELTRASGTEDLFAALEKIPTYVIPRKRVVRQSRRLLKLARALSDDSIEDRAVESARKGMVSHLRDALTGKRSHPTFRAAVEGKETITFGLQTYDVRTDQAEQGASRSLATSPENIDHLFDTAGRVIQDGLHIDLLDELTQEDDDPDAIRRAKVEVAVLLSDPEVRQGVDNLAERLVQEKRGRYHAQVDDLPDKRRETYREVAAMAPRPEETSIRLPDVMEGTDDDTVDIWDGHLFADEDGKYRAKLNNWERDTLEATFGSAVAWLRNVPRKPWAICVPYSIRGEDRPMYPDLVMFNRDGGRVIVDILDPHDPGRDDAAPKAAGLARYAADHGHLFGRIWLIARYRRWLSTSRSHRAEGSRRGESGHDLC